MRTERGLDRFVTFLDAVVAIAITLLVLPLTEVLVGSEADGSLGRVLADHTAQFATQVVAAYPPEPLAVLIYIGTITLSSVFLSGVSFLVWRRPGLRRGADEAPAPPWAALATTGILVVALLLGTLIREVNYWAMFLLFLSAPLEWWLRGTQRSR